MNSIGINVFQDELKTTVEQLIERHEPLRVTQQEGPDFIVISAEDWEREQETLYVLQNSDLMRQISESQSRTNSCNSF